MHKMTEYEKPKQFFGLGLQYVPSYSVYKWWLTISTVSWCSITYQMPKYRNKIKWNAFNMILYMLYKIVINAKKNYIHF